jgi:hypothetical protein
MEIAVSSAMETRDSLKDGVDRGYFTPERVRRAQQLAERSIRCSTKLIVMAFVERSVTPHFSPAPP